MEHTEHLDSSRDCRPYGLQRNLQLRISAFACKFERILFDIRSALFRHPLYSFVSTFVTVPWRGKMNFHKRHIPLTCRIQIYIVQRSQSSLFETDATFSNIQIHKMNLLLPPTQYWRLLRGKHRFGLLKFKRAKNYFNFIDGWREEFLPPSLQWTSIGRCDLSVLPTTDLTRLLNSRMAFENGHVCECHSV